MGGVVGGTVHRRNWAKILGAESGHCAFCGDELPVPRTDHTGRPGHICERCQPLHQRIKDAIKRILAGRRCSICRDQSMPGLRHCERHAYLLNPCPCGERIKRRDGPGRQPEHCRACQKKRRIEAELRGDVYEP